MEFVRRMAVLRPILNDLAADVICLQEVAAQKPPPHVGRRFLALDRLLCDTAYQSYYRTTSVRPGTKRQSRIFVQQMKTKWGSCNPANRSIRLNTELAKKPPKCRKYVVVHEMVHLLVQRHNNTFANLLDTCLPNWKPLRQTLNAAPLAHANWDY